MPKMGNSAGYLRQRSQEDVDTQRKMDEDYKQQAKHLPEILKERGCKATVHIEKRAYHLKGGLEVLPEVREYYEHGKRYVGFPVR